MKKIKPLILILLVSLAIGCASAPAGFYYYEEGFRPRLKPEIENTMGQTLATGSVSAAYGMGNIQGDYQQTAGGGGGAPIAAPAVAPSAGTVTYPPTGETFSAADVVYTPRGNIDVIRSRNRKFGPSVWGHWPIFRSASDQANYYAWERQYGGEGLSYLNPYKPIRYTDTPRRRRTGGGGSITGSID